MTHTRHPSDPPPLPPRHARLWAFAATMLAQIVSWFGSPEALVRDGRVNARWVWDFAPRLQPLGALVKRLVLAYAHALGALPPTPSRTPCCTRTSKTPRTPAPAWRGRFVLMLWPGAAKPPERAPPRRVHVLAYEPRLAERKTIDVAPYARRLDALARTIADPRPAALRLAARMRRANAPMRAPPRPRLHPRARAPDEWRPVLREAHALASAPDRRLRRESG